MFEILEHLPYITVAAFCIYAQCGEDAAKREVGGHVLNSHGNYIADHGKSWKNHGIVFLNFCGNLVISDLFSVRQRTFESTI